MPGWYVSYAWGDDRTPEGCARDEIVEKLCSAGNEKGIVIQRDKCSQLWRKHIRVHAADRRR